MATAIAADDCDRSQTFKRVEIDSQSKCQPTSTFDPARHMSFASPGKTFTFEELGLSSPLATGPIGITEPFPLFSAEGIRAIRADLFRPELLVKHTYRENKTPGIYKIRGYAKDAPFVYSTWTSSEILKACSEAAGVQLEVVFDYEIGHINVQVPSDGVSEDEYNILQNLPPAEPPKQNIEIGEADRHAARDDEGTLTAWHNDSYPWVCVCMLSDPTGMTGGETALRKGDGSIFKVRGPQIGFAVMMQGGLINHVALKAVGAGERITMVTSFRPKDPKAYDSSNLGNVKKVSDHDKLFYQWSSYRAMVIEKRTEAFRESLQGMSAKEISERTRDWAEEQIEYLKVTARELTHEGEKGNYN